MNFVEETRYLRNLYILVDGRSLHLKILTKLQSYAFYNEYTTISSYDSLPIGKAIDYDSLPIGKAIVIDCSTLPANRMEIEKALTEVLHDLKYNDFSVSEERPFNESHKLVITIK